MANSSPPIPPGNPRGHFSRSTVFPLLSNPAQLGSKGHLIPGVVTIVATFALFATLNKNNGQNEGDFSTFTTALAYYITFIQCLVVYLLCGRRQLWLPMIGVFVVAYGLMWTPLIWVMMPVFHFSLAMTLEESGEFIQRFIGFFFAAGLFEELYKALPLLALAAFALYRKRQAGTSRPDGLVILAEPLDGIALGVAAGAAFAIFETLYQYMPDRMHMPEIIELQKTNPDLAHLKFLFAQGPGLQLLIGRLASQIAGHLAFSGYFGYFIGLAVLRPKSAPLFLLIGLGSAAAFHAAWDASEVQAVEIFVGILCYVCLVAALLKARQISPTRAENFATVVMPYVPPAGAQAPQQSRTPAPPLVLPEAVVKPAQPRAPAKLILKIGPVAFNLTGGASIEPQMLGSAGAGRGKKPIADIVSHPNNAAMLGLRNLSDRPYRARLESGMTIEVTNGQTVQLAPGIVIDFGGIEGVVRVA